MQDIVGAITFCDSLKIKVNFDCTGRQQGSWDVVVTNPGQQLLILTEGIRIGEGFVNLWIDIVGRNQIRVGRETNLYIVIGNNGNINSKPIFVQIFLPEGLECEKITYNDNLFWSQTLLKYSLEKQNNFNTNISFDGSIIDLGIIGIDPNQQDVFNVTYYTTINQGDFEIKIEMRNGKIEEIIVPLVLEKSIELEIDPNAYDLSEEFKIFAIEKCRDAALAVYQDLINEWRKKPSNNEIFQYIKNIINNLIDRLFGHDEFAEDIQKFINMWEQIQEAQDISEKVKANIVKLKAEIPDFEIKTKEKFGITVQSLDPNEKTGPDGIDTLYHYIQLDHDLEYFVYFENVDSATAAAEEVLIKDTLDVDLDWSTFELGEIVFGDKTINPPSQSQSYSTNVILNDTTHVEITCSFDQGNGIAQWYLRGTDPRDGYFMGFLPPNVNSPEGEGHVSFTVEPESGLASGTQIMNRASIIFDVNPPMMTNEVMNTIDAAAPNSSIIDCQNTELTQVNVEWFGEDEPSGSGVKDYSVHVAMDGGPYTTWLQDTSITSANYPIEEFHRYDFYSEARDSVGHKEPMPLDPDTSLLPMAFYMFPDFGWYMNSLPVEAANDSAEHLFPSALQAFGWNSAGGSYYVADRLLCKTGYWLAMPEGDTLIVSGTKLDSATCHYQQGWHMIGSISQPVDVSNPNDNPDGAVLAFFGWDHQTGTYYPTTMLNPKEGYWMAVMEECDFRLGDDTPFEKIAKARADEESFYKEFGSEPPPPPDFYFEKRNLTQVPETYALYQNYPNPFNSETIIKYQLPKAGKVSFKIYNILGQEVCTLFDGNKVAGYHQIMWDGKDNSGRFVSSGIYIYQIQSGEFQSTKKMLMLR